MVLKLGSVRERALLRLGQPEERARGVERGVGHGRDVVGQTGEKEEAGVFARGRERRDNFALREGEINRRDGLVTP